MGSAAWGRVTLMPRKLSLLSRLDSPVKIMAAIFALVVSAIGTGWGVKVGLDFHYASAAEVRKNEAETQKKFDKFELFLSRKDLRDLKKELGELERQKESGRLNSYDKKRYDEIKDDIGTLQQQLKGVR